MENPYGLMFIYYLNGSVRSFPESDKSFIGNWEEDGFSFLFFRQKSDDAIHTFLKKHPHLTLLDQYQMTYDEWQGEVLKPFLSGQFLIRQPWNQPDFLLTSIRGTIPIILDPGVVFGAGNHPTTATCLEFITEIFKEKTPVNVLDLGTGTGLLALACGVLGAEKILALDFNFLAAKTTRLNILHNRLEDRILSVQGLAEDYISSKADLLITNIHYDIMKDLIVSPGFLTKKKFILSGLLKSQSLKIETMLESLPVTICDKKTTDGIWFTYRGKRQE